MKITNPLTWFGKSEEKEALWVLVNPKKPHISFHTFSEEKESPWPNGIRLTGIEPAGFLGIYGMIIDWEKFSPDEQNQIKTGYMDLPLKRMLTLVRPKIAERGQ